MGRVSDVLGFSRERTGHISSQNSEQNFLKTGAGGAREFLSRGQISIWNEKQFQISCRKKLLLSILEDKFELQTPSHLAHHRSVVSPHQCYSKI